jgi:chromosome partitioning protein
MVSQSLKQGGMRVVTVANRKGGVGKTSSVIQIASGLARRGERVLAIDGDPQGNLTLFFGGKDKKDFGEMLGAMVSGAKFKPDEYINHGVRRHLDIIPAKNRNLRLEMHDTDIASAYDPFASFVATIKERYDWVIIDSSPSNSPLERLLIRASDAVIIPLEFQLFSVSGLESILDEVQFCAGDANRDIRVHSLIFTKAENRLNRVNTYRQVFSSFHIPIFEICKSEYVTRSIEKSRTIWECGPSSYAARDYARIIDKGFLETV